jgi:uncharacterized membrane protein YgcG
VLLRIHDFFVVDAHYAQPPPALLRAVAEHAALWASATAAAADAAAVLPQPAVDVWAMLRAGTQAAAREAEAMSQHLRRDAAAAAAAAAAAPAAVPDCVEPSPLTVGVAYAVLLAWVAAERAPTARLVVRGVALDAAAAGAPVRYVEFPAAWLVGELPAAALPAAADAAACGRVVDAAWRGRAAAAAAAFAPLARMHAGSPAELGLMYGFRYSFAAAAAAADMRPTPPRGALPRPSVREFSVGSAGAGGAAPAPAAADIWPALVDADDLRALRASAPAAAAAAADGDGGDGGKKRRRSAGAGAGAGAGSVGGSSSDAQAPRAPATIRGLIQSYGFTAPAGGQG